MKVKVINRVIMDTSRVKHDPEPMVTVTKGSKVLGISGRGNIIWVRFLCPIKTKEFETQDHKFKIVAADQTFDNVNVLSYLGSEQIAHRPYHVFEVA